MKRWYDKILQMKEFKEDDKVLLFNWKFKIFGKGKLKSKWKDRMSSTQSRQVER
jgi:hypothetical protein